MTRMDAYFDFRIGFEVADLAPFITRLDLDANAGATSYMHITEDGTECLYIRLPGGIIFELLHAA